MKKHFWDRKIPTWGAVVLLITTLWITTALIRSTVSVVSHASPDTTPQNVMIGNITDTSFTVTYTTASPATGAVEVQGGGTLSQVVPDKRDSSLGSQKQYYSHFIVVTHVQPSTPYQFSIDSNTQSFLDNGKKYTVTTAATLPEGNTDHTISGHFNLPDGNAASDALVTITIPGAQTLIALTNTSGAFSVSTAKLRTKDLLSYMLPTDSTIVTLNATEQDQTTQASTLFVNSENIPTMTLSSNYDFTNSTQESTEASGAANLTIPTPKKVSGKIAITFPADTQSLSDQRPLFRGTALPNQKVIITIHSDAGTTVTVAADQNGLWSYRPADPLPAGDHMITIQSPNSAGVLQEISQQFTVYASGAQLAGQIPSISPTAPVTMAPTPTITQVPTLTPTTEVTASPTPTEEALSPTPTSDISPETTPTTTLLPTATPTPFVIATSTPRPSLAPTGSNSSFVLTAVSVAFILSGTTLLFLL